MKTRALTPTVSHGKPSTYTNYGCRCTDCRHGWATYAAQRRKAARTNDRKKAA